MKRATVAAQGAPGQVGRAGVADQHRVGVHEPGVADHRHQGLPGAGGGEREPLEEAEVGVEAEQQDVPGRLGLQQQRQRRGDPFGCHHLGRWSAG